MSKWSSEFPGVEGWYWYRGYEGPDPTITYVELSYGEFWLGKGEGADAVDDVGGGVEWIGPLPVPALASADEGE